TIDSDISSNTSSDTDSNSKASKSRPSKSKDVQTPAHGFALRVPIVGSFADHDMKGKRNVDMKGDISVIPSPNLINTNIDMGLPPRAQRHPYLRFEGLEYTNADIVDFEERLGKIYGRGVHRVQVFNFGGLTDLMVERLSGQMLMEHKDAQG
ncbi:hypothetical protein Tco_1389290, partial [Tanacetum coccineum]